MANEWDRINEKKLATIKPFLDEAPVKITEMAEKLGIGVFRADLGPDKAGQILADSASESGYRIRVSRDDTYLQQRFTAAHEIAHYLIHEDKIGKGIHDTGLYRSLELSDDQEMEANRLATMLLVPDEMLLYVLEKFGGLKELDIVKRMAKQFQVEEWLMALRLGVKAN